jgi:EVE domain
MNSNWIAVASAEHVSLGRADGFMQVCHGKSAPLRRVTPGSRVVYYSPTGQFGGKDKLQSFTAIGVVRTSEPYLFDMGGGFHPFRRDVTWLTSQPAPIQPLLEKLEFSAGVRNWGQKFRYGLFSISDHDMGVIADAMGARFPEH